MLTFRALCFQFFDKVFQAGPPFFLECPEWRRSWRWQWRNTSTKTRSKNRPTPTSRPSAGKPFKILISSAETRSIDGHKGNTYWGGRLSTVDLTFKVVCFAKNMNNIFNIKRSWSKLVSTRRSTVLSLFLQWDFPGLSHALFGSPS